MSASGRQQSYKPQVELIFSADFGRFPPYLGRIGPEEKQGEPMLASGFEGGLPAVAPANTEAVSLPASVTGN